MPTKGEGWITARQAGRVLNMSPSWVKQRAREGRLQYETVGNSWFFRWFFRHGSSAIKCEKQSLKKVWGWQDHVR
jgi:hypothetical protein